MKLVLIGDSIRQGYQPLVVKKLVGKAEVWGPVENCRHSLWAYAHFQEWVTDQNPDVLHFNFGIHDALVMEEDGRNQILLDQYCLNLERFIRAAVQLKIAMIWATTTPMYALEPGVPMARWAKKPEIDEYNAAALEIATARGLAVNDLHQVILDNDYTKCLTQDGCHMTEFGNEVLSEAVVRALNPAG